MVPKYLPTNYLLMEKKNNFTMDKYGKYHLNLVINVTNEPPDMGH